jgi:hypothetical protein
MREVDDYGEIKRQLGDFANAKWIASIGLSDWWRGGKMAGQASSDIHIGKRTSADRFFFGLFYLHGLLQY